MAQQQTLPAELEQKLNNMECPFKWVNVVTADDIRVVEHDFHGKVREELETSNDYDFVEYGFPRGVCLIYEYIVSKKARDTVKEVIDICEVKLKSVFENRRNHSLVRKARLAFVHILQGCKAHFERHYGDVNSLQYVLKDIPDHNKFNENIRACINGIKAAFLIIYGPYKTTEIGVQCAKTAIELDSTEGWYYFLVGKGLYRRRKVVDRYKHPSDEEIDYVERARQLEFKCTESDMFLIEMYSEMIEKGNCRENYLTKAVELCRSIYKDSEDWNCLWRCARGLNRINDQQCTDLMQQCLEKANRLSPNNPEIMFLFSKFYLYKKCNMSEALHYAQSAVEHGGPTPIFGSHSLKLMYLKDRLKDLTSLFDEYISKAQTAFNRHVLMCLKARYLLQERRCNLKVLLEIFARILQEDTECLLQKEPKRNKELYHLLPTLFSDIQEAVKKLSLRNKDEKDYCEIKLKEITQLYPVLLKIRPPQIRDRKQWWIAYFNVYNEESGRLRKTY